MATALQAKEVEYGNNGFSNFLPAIDQGLPFVGIAMGMGDGAKKFFDDQLAIVATGTSGIKTVADLVGKKIGTLTSGTTDEYTTAVLARANIPLDRVTIQNVPFPSAVQTLASGQVDVVVEPEPYATMCLSVPGAQLVQRGGGYLSFSTFFMTRPDIIDSQPEVTQRVIDGWVEACWWTRQNLDEAADISTRWVPGLDSATSRKAIRFVPYDPRITSLVYDAMEDQKKLLVEQKKLKTDVDVHKVVNETYVDKSVQTHPEWVADLKKVG
jgi:ABC-type nitrate/sulfonate/bicarbonate transport system substrate-binding protein